MCDVGKWTAVHQSRGVFQSLYQVWFDGVFKQNCHRAVYLEVFGVDRFVVIGVSDQNVAQTLLEVLHIRCKAQDCHNLAGNGNLEAVLTRDTVCFSAQSDVDKAQCAVVHVHAAFEENAALVDIQLVALLHMVVQDGAQQVVCRADGVKVAGEMQVDVLHRHDLCIAAAGSAALDAEYRTQGRLAQSDDGFFANLLHRLSKTDGCGGLAFTRRSRVDSGDQDQFAVRLVFQTFGKVVRKLCLVVTVRFQLLRTDTERTGYFGDGLHSTLLGDFDVCKHG